jgi:hypothetical protein
MERVQVIGEKARMLVVVLNNAVTTENWEDVGACIMMASEIANEADLEIRDSRRSAGLSDEPPSVHGRGRRRTEPPVK